MTQLTESTLKETSERSYALILLLWRYTSNWVAELFGPSNLKKSTSGFPQRLYNSVLQGALGIDKDGIFGANTEKTVKEFQSAHGLTADGIAGAKTKAALAKQL